MRRLDPGRGPAWRWWRGLLAAAIVASLAGCVSMPGGGPVRAYTVTQGPNGQDQPIQQFIPQPPGHGWSPTEIVRGFLAASASFSGQQKVAREYLTPAASRTWNPAWSATVFSDGPDVSGPIRLGAGAGAADESVRAAGAVDVLVHGKVQATLSGSGAYAVPSTTHSQQFSFTVIKYHGQWRISDTHSNPMLLTSTEFTVDYQLRNLYFFDPTFSYLVPDPVYVPLHATLSDLVNGLVQGLVRQPRDWLAGGATRTAFPPGARLLGEVTVDGGTAAVNLGGAATDASGRQMEQISAQLLSTLTGAGQGQQQVQSVELSVDGKPFIPSSAQGNPVQRSSSLYTVPMGPGNEFYYLDSRGELWRQHGAAGNPVKVAAVGTGYSAIAVSPDGEYLAALRGGSVFTGRLTGGLTPREVGTGYTSLSWDRNDNLWAASSTGIVMLRPAAKRGNPPVSVSVMSSYGGSTGPVTALRVAPDGVRVALVIGGQQAPELAFGAIVMQQAGERPGQQPAVSIALSPFSVYGSGTAFSSLTWYGPNNVIALGQPGPTVTEYPVNGGPSTTIPSQPGITSISASASGGLIAGLSSGLLSTDVNTTGAWASTSHGLTPVYPG